MCTATAPELSVRRLRPGERHRVLEVFNALSPASRFLRFHVPMPVLPGRFLRTLADVRPGHREAVLALAGERAVGLGQWARLDADPGTADVSLMVADDHQHRGVGRRLLAELARVAGGHGVDHFSCWVHPDNTAAYAGLVSLGAHSGDDGRQERLLAIPDLTRRLAPGPSPAGAAQARAVRAASVGETVSQRLSTR